MTNCEDCEQFPKCDLNNYDPDWPNYEDCLNYKNIENTKNV